jgi:hypothetical protein
MRRLEAGQNVTSGATELYFDRVSQVAMSRWSAARYARTSSCRTFATSVWAAIAGKP